MFGANKKKESEKTVTQIKETGVEDKIEFDFEEDDKLPFDDDGFVGDDDAVEEEEPRQRMPSRTVILLGLLLLLAVVGGGYFYLNSTPAPPPPAPVTKKVKVPATPVAQPSPAPAVAVKPASPVPVAAVKPASPVPVAAAPVQSPQPVPVTKAQVAPPVAKTTAAPLVAKSEVASPEVRVPATHQPFTLSAGAFLNQKDQHEIEKKIRRLGYTPKIKTSYSMVPMIRLLLGVYDPTSAASQSRALLAQVPDLFTLKKGDKVALYAGSYQSLDSARSYSDQLYLRGIHVDEESVTLRMPLKVVSYGSFSTRAAAEKAAKRAVSAGLTAKVMKR